MTPNPTVDWNILSRWMFDELSPPEKEMVEYWLFYDKSLLDDLCQLQKILCELNLWKSDPIKLNELLQQKCFESHD